MLQYCVYCEILGNCCRENLQYLFFFLRILVILFYGIIDGAAVIHCSGYCWYHALHLYTV